MSKKKGLIQVKNYKGQLPKGVVDGVINGFKDKKADIYILGGGTGMTKGAEKSWRNFKKDVNKKGSSAEYFTTKQANKILYTLINNLFNNNKNTN